MQAHEQLLGKKKEFRKACQALSDMASACDEVCSGLGELIPIGAFAAESSASESAEPDFDALKEAVRAAALPLLGACHQCCKLLQTRYTSAIFWQSGLDFFLTMQFFLESVQLSDHADAKQKSSDEQQARQAHRQVERYVELAIREVDEE